MANRKNKKRIDDLEQDLGGGDEVVIKVDWSTEPGKITDDNGELITVEEYKRRHPDRKLKIVNTDDCWD